MSSPLFDSSCLAIVAYAHVDGATGAAVNTTSGIACADKCATTRLSLGTYQIMLNTGLGQGFTKDLIIATPMITTAIALNGARSAMSFDVSDLEKRIIIHGAAPGSATCIDSDFDVVVLRTTLPG